ncbi:hydroxysteroid 11-beta-dehydrogenase 1-like protein [Bufo gargarizans]|uniref:hydroxysteroid 11-beta-dehydrogenase 1-like protein n=1 Tax=Bufo gargarizans TaxID=30331 RepID=UPI001CF58D08|nr:hydroxysteroid 11-beta-dehydrogenase 1-like protein [Bufo gargarizans]
MGLKIKGLSLVAFVAVLGYLYRDTFDPASLLDARVLVTGASTGIGAEMAYNYARAGAHLVLTARRESVLATVRSRCLELGAKNVSLVVADMGSPEARERIVEKAIIDMGGLDYLVLNHIGSTPFQMWDGDINHTRWLMEVCIPACICRKYILCLMGTCQQFQLTADSGQNEIPIGSLIIEI